MYHVSETLAGPQRQEIRKDRQNYVPDRFWARGSVVVEALCYKR
jgi:hypothetical protein